METMFWRRLKQLCEERGTTPSGVCKATGLSTGSPTAWKAGRLPSAAVREKITAYFGVEPEYFVAETENPPARVEPREEDLRYAMFGGVEVSDETWEKVKAFVRFAAEEDRRRREGS